jgi:hypothetical protein
MLTNFVTTLLGIWLAPALFRPWIIEFGWCVMQPGGCYGRFSFSYSHPPLPTLGVKYPDCHILGLEESKIYDATVNIEYFMNVHLQITLVYFVFDLYDIKFSLLFSG